MYGGAFRDMCVVDGISILTCMYSLTCHLHCECKRWKSILEVKWRGGKLEAREASI